MREMDQIGNLNIKISLGIVVNFGFHSPTRKIFNASYYETHQKNSYALKKIR